MNERNLILAGSVLGALAGAAIAFMYFTPRGQQWRRDAEQNLDQLAREAERFMGAVEQVRTGVAELRGSTQAGWPKTA